VKQNNISVRSISFHLGNNGFRFRHPPIFRVQRPQYTGISHFVQNSQRIGIVVPSGRTKQRRLFPCDFNQNFFCFQNLFPNCLFVDFCQIGMGVGVISDFMSCTKNTADSLRIPLSIFSDDEKSRMNVILF